MALAASIAALLAAALGGHAAPPAPTVPCGDHIQHTSFPYRAGGYRLVLGAVSVPPRSLQQVVETGSDPWTHWRKAGLVVRAGSGPVTVGVARGWRSRAAIAWGQTPIGPSLRFAGCPPGSGGWAYAGGFYLRDRSACVPLVFRIGSRVATVRFGVGRRCPGSD